MVELCIPAALQSSVQLTSFRPGSHPRKGRKINIPDPLPLFRAAKATEGWAESGNEATVQA